MAEALGLISSIATLIELSAKIAGLSYSYAREVKNAPKTQRQYLQEISALIEVLYRVEQAVAESESTGLIPARPPSLNEDALMDCYKELSRLYFELERRKSRFLRPFQDRELKPHIDMLQKFRALFTDYLSSCILVTTTATYKKVSLVHHEQDRSLLLTWVPTPTIPLRQKPSPCPGTGGWFLDSVAVRTWISRSTELLWCHGPPGVGKSYLASVVIDRLLEERKQNFLVVYFFCDFSSQNQIKTIDVLHHLFRQIIDQGSGEMLSILKESCGDPSTLQNANQLVQLLILAASVQPIYMVVDGLDELKSPHELLTHILELAKSKIHILTTSRDLPQIRKKMGSAMLLEIKPTNSDLRLYVASRLQESDFAEEVARDSSLINDIVSKTGNIFLLSRLLLDELLNLVTIHQIRKALQRPPQGLQQALEATLQRIDAQPSARRTLARRLLSWIMVAERRLKLDEVVTAFAVEDGEELQPDNMPSPGILLQVCAGLVVLNKHDNTLGLVHAFAYEVLHLLLPSRETNLDMARTCLRYLSLKPLATGSCASSAAMIKRLNSLAFLEYSSKYWGQHVVLGDFEEELEMLIMKLLNNAPLRNNAFQALQFRADFANTTVTEELFQSLPTNPEALHLAAYWGLTYIAGKFLEAGAPPSAVDSHRWTPLHWACANNKLPVAELLMRSGANVNAQDIQGWSPLFWAAFVGNIDMVRLLLSNGANHLARSTLGWTALHWAISGGHMAIVKELLEHHSQSQSSEPVFHKMTMEEIESYANATLPVDVAAAGQDTNIFTMLIEHLQTPRNIAKDVKFNMIWERERFDVPVSYNPWRTMTKGERLNGRESNVPRFTGRNSEEWRSDSKKWKSVLLLSAIRDQQFSSVELLVKAGADVDYEDALCIAACRRDPRYVQCLLRSGANPNIKNRYGRTALHEAVMNGFVETIAALLDGGANIDEPVTRNYRMGYSNNYLALAGYRIELSENGSTALIQTSGFSLKTSLITETSDSDLAMQITRLLLSRGADTRLKDLSGRTALHYAVIQPHLPLVKLLVQAGCPVDAVDHNGATPMHLLALHRKEDLDVRHLKEVVSLLMNGKHENDQAKMLVQSLRAKPAPGGEPDSEGEDKPVLYKETVIKGTGGQSIKLKRLEGFVEGVTPLGMALQAGRWGLVQILLGLGATFPVDLDLTPILDHAIKSIEPHMTDILLQHGADPSPDAIHSLTNSFAARTTNAEPSKVRDSNTNFGTILERLVSVGADINFCQDEETPLTFVASKRGSQSALKALINAGADIYKASSKTFDPILTAALFGEAGDVACLLDYAVAHLKEDHWSTHLAEFSNESDPIMRVCLCLQKAGAINRTNSDGRTILHLAAEKGHITLVNSLVSCGVKADIADSNEWLAVHCAGFADQTAVLKFLLEHSTESSVKTQEILNKEDTTSSKHTMLNVAVMNQNIEMAKIILEHGAKTHSSIDPNSKIKHWRRDVPMLGYAAENGYEGILSILLQNGADIEGGDEYGWRPLHFACYRGHTEIAKILIDAGADVHAATVKWNEPNIKPTGLYQDNPWTGQPLHLATMSGQADIVKLLLEKDVDIHASTGVDPEVSYHYPGHGPTSLHLALDTNLFYGRRGQALDHGRLQIAQWLVERGAMVRGIICQYSLQNILNFRDFPGLWDALVAGDKDEASI